MPDLSPLLFYNSNPPRWFPPTPMVLNTRPHLSLVFLANSKLLLTPLLGCHKLCTVKIELFILTYSFLYTSHQFCSTEQYIPIQKSFILFPLPWIYYNLIICFPTDKSSQTKILHLTTSIAFTKTQLKPLSSLVFSNPLSIRQPQNTTIQQLYIELKIKARPLILPCKALNDLAAAHLSALMSYHLSVAPARLQPH